MKSASVEIKMKKVPVNFTATFIGLSGYPDSCGLCTESPVVELESSFWSVRLYPGGVDKDSEGFLSCFIICESPGSTRASFKITILNQKGWKNHHFCSDSVKDFNNPIDRGYSSMWGDPKFIAHSYLKNATNGICVDDKLIVQVELVIYGQVEKTVTSSNLHSAGSPVRKRNILDDLSSLLFDRATADINIIAACISGQIDRKIHLCEKDESSLSSLTSAVFNDDTNCIPVHKFILSMRSPVFKAMFASELSETTTSEVIIPDFDSEVVKHFVRYLYTDCFDSPGVLDTHAETLLAMACKYEVSGLESICENHLCMTLGSHNVVNILYLADLYNAMQLKSRALHYIAHNAKLVVQLDGFFQSLSVSLCQEVIKTLAGVDGFGSNSSKDDAIVTPANFNPDLHIQSSSSSSSTSPGKPALNYQKRMVL